MTNAVTKKTQKEATLALALELIETIDRSNVSYWQASAALTACRAFLKKRFDESPFPAPVVEKWKPSIRESHDKVAEEGQDRV